MPGRDLAAAASGFMQAREAVMQASPPLPSAGGWERWGGVRFGPDFGAGTSTAPMPADSGLPSDLGNGIPTARAPDQVPACQAVPERAALPIETGSAVLSCPGVGGGEEIGAASPHAPAVRAEGMPASLEPDPTAGRQASSAGVSDPSDLAGPGLGHQPSAHHEQQPDAEASHASNASVAEAATAPSLAAEAEPAAVGPPRAAVPPRHMPDSGDTSLVPPQAIATLLRRGDRMFELHDISAARLLYERAAEAGSGVAALRLGMTYDPNVLADLQSRGVGADAAAAEAWYQKASEMGEAEAGRLLARLPAP